MELSQDLKSVRQGKIAERETSESLACNTLLLISSQSLVANETHNSVITQIHTSVFLRDE